MMPDLAVTRLASSTKARNFLLGGPSLGTSVSALWGTCAAYLVVQSRFRDAGPSRRGL